MCGCVLLPAQLNRVCVQVRVQAWDLATPEGIEGIKVDFLQVTDARLCGCAFVHASEMGQFSCGPLHPCIRTIFFL